jgi:hypothetical protein
LEKVTEPRQLACPRNRFITIPDDEPRLNHNSASRSNRWFAAAIETPNRATHE